MNELFYKICCWLLAKNSKKVLKKHTPLVIGVVDAFPGSQIKEILRRVLSSRYNNQNQMQTSGHNMGDRMGVLLTILGYQKKPLGILWPYLLMEIFFKTLEKSYPKLLILEIDSGQKEIGSLSQTLKLDLAVINQLPANQKIDQCPVLKLIQGEAKIFINADEFTDLAGSNYCTVGIKNEKVDFRAVNLLRLPNAFNYRIVAIGQNIAIKSKVKDEQEIYQELLSFAVGQFLGIQSLRVKKFIEEQ